jgi:hypothetical protein
MITDVPTAEDFAQEGVAFLSLAWDVIFKLIIQLRDTKEWNGLDVPEVPDQYWNAAKYELATSLTLAHQGTEFLSKARIAENILDA